MRALVIGSGLSGLCAAHTLQRNGHNVLVLEGASRTGGNVQTLRHNGYLVESGPNALQLNDPELEVFLAQIGLLEHAIEANPQAARRYIIRYGRPIPVPISPWQALRSELFSARGKLRLLREPFIGRGDDPEETLAHFVRRRLGKAFLDYAIDPMVRGVYAGDPEVLITRHAFPKVYNLETRHGSLIRGALAKRKTPRFKTRLLSWPKGMDTLTHKLGKSLQIHCDCILESLEPNGHNWRVQWEDAEGAHCETFEALFIAVSVKSLQKLPFPPTLLTILEPLNQLPCPPVSVLALGFPCAAIAHPLDGFGMLVPRNEKLNILGTLFSSTLFPGRAPDGHALLTTFIGGSTQPEHANLGDADLKTLVLRDLDQLLGIQSNPTFCERIHWPHAIPQYTNLYTPALRALQTLETRYHNLRFIGNYRGGIAAGKCLLNAQATVNILGHA